jgi:hypothetical protein
MAALPSAAIGNAKLTDQHLASTIHCVDDEIIEWRRSDVSND